MNKELREKANEYLETNGFQVHSKTLDELITLIRTATLDEVKEAYEYEANMQGLPQEVFNAIGKAIDNLRGSDDGE